MIQLVYGSEPYLVDLKIRKAKEEVSELGFFRFEGFSTKVEELSIQFPFIDLKQVIVVNISCLGNDDAILEFIKNYEGKNDIYFVAKEVDKRTSLYKYFVKNKMIFECNRIIPEDFDKFVLGLINKEGGRIEKTAFNIFKTRCGYFECNDITLYTVKTYVKQLLFASNIITEDIVERNVPESLTLKTFRMTELLLRRKADELFSLSTSLLGEKESPIGILSLLLRSFRLAYKASLYSDMREKELGEMLGVPVYQFKDALQYSPETLEVSLNILQGGVNEIKNGVAGANVVFFITLGKVLSALEQG